MSVPDRVSASIQNEFLAGDLDLRGTDFVCLQMSAIANHYLTGRERERGEEPKGMCNQKGRRTLDEARMPTAPSLAWAVPGVFISVK